MEQIKRINTGIKGIDKMIQGGIPENSVIGVSGPAGVGKSIMALQFVHDGIMKNEKSVYINLEEPRENVEKTLKTLSFGKNVLEDSGKNNVKIVCLNYETFEKVYPDLFNKIEKDKKIKRLVIDSFNCFFSYLKLEKYSSKQGYEIRKILSNAFALFRRKEFTTLLILENGSEHNSDLNHYVQYMVDGIIHMDYISLGSIERRIFIPKMRWTKQYDSSLPFDITDKGINVKSPQ